MISRRRALALAFAAALPALLHGPCDAAAEVRYDRQVRTVDIPTRPEFPNSLILDMTRVMPEVNGEHALAVTYGDITWRFKSSGLSGQCVIDSPLVEVKARVSIPEWPRWRDAAPNWQSAWICIDKYLVAHENTHADIWRETGDQIDAALAEFRQPSACTTFKERASAAAQRAYDAGRRRQQDFDAGQKRFADVRRCLEEFNASISGDKAKPATAEAPTRAAVAMPVSVPPAPDGEMPESAPRLVSANVPSLAIFAGIMLLGGAFALLMRAVSDKPGAPRGDGGHDTPPARPRTAAGGTASAPGQRREFSARRSRA